MFEPPTDLDAALGSCLVRFIVINFYLLCFFVCVAVSLYLFNHLMSWYFYVLRSILYHILYH